jgi:hypothetical protein
MCDDLLNLGEPVSQCAGERVPFGPTLGYASHTQTHRLTATLAVALALALALMKWIGSA